MLLSSCLRCNALGSMDDHGGGAQSRTVSMLLQDVKQNLLCHLYASTISKGMAWEFSYEQLSSKEIHTTNTTTSLTSIN